ncbi:MAG: lactococcin 972 family bacteriocin [Propionibacteriaceae bacterium]|nr:lactococcin 972 family bacteriocin [Propionibacteriaceae bacterium]
MKMKRKMASAIASGLMVVGLVTPMAAAITKDVGGGTWSYGVTYRNGEQATVYSHYYHKKVFHRASTVNGYGEYSCHATRAGQTAWASQRAHPGKVDRSYWSKYDACP